MNITVEWITSTAYGLACILEDNFITVLVIIAIFGFLYGWLYNEPRE